MCELYVSDEVLKMKGSNFINIADFDELKALAVNGEVISLDGYYQGLYIDKDDLDNLYVHLNKGEETFANVKDIIEDESSFEM